MSKISTFQVPPPLRFSLPPKCQLHIQHRCKKILLYLFRGLVYRITAFKLVVSLRTLTNQCPRLIVLEPCIETQ